MADNKDFLNFQQDGLDYLYNLEPTQNNLFWVGDFNDKKDGEPGHKFNNAQFRIQSLSFSLPSLEFEDQKQLQIQVLKSVTNTKEVTMTWIDDYAHSVQRYHLDWFRCWYNRELDCLVRGPAGKYRGCDVYLFHYTDAAEGDKKVAKSLFATPQAQPIAKITLGGLAPKSLGEFKVEMGNSGADSAVSYNYAVNKIKIDWYADAIKGRFPEEPFIENGGLEYIQSKQDNDQSMYL